MRTEQNFLVNLVLLLLFVIVLPLLVPETAEVKPFSMTVGESYRGGWGNLFILKTDFLNTSYLAKCSVKNCWLPLGIIYILMLVSLRTILAHGTRG